jgi:hypothetical protein
VAVAGYHRHEARSDHVGGRISFDNAIRAVGGKLVIAYSHDELKSAISGNTAMIYTTARGENLEKVVQSYYAAASGTARCAAHRLSHASAG